MEMQAIAQVADNDVIQAISELPDHEISDLFLRVAEKLNNPDSIKKMADRLLNHCRITYGI